MTTEPPVATIFNSDTFKHFMTSAYLIGDLIQEYDKRNILVSCYPAEVEREVPGNDGKMTKVKFNTDVMMKAILDKYGIPDENRLKGSQTKSPKLVDKLQDTATQAIAKGSHVVFMPNSTTDLNENPQEMSALVSMDGHMACEAVMSGYVKAKLKPKDDKEFAQKMDESRIMPHWKYQFSDFEYFDNKVKQNGNGLKEFFYPDPK